MNNNDMPLLGKIVLVVVAIAAITGVVAALGILGAVMFFAFVTVVAINKSPSNARGRDEPGGDC